jgi:succinate dehydrogenase / fumarate reductase, cytochrome b subunit
MADTRAPIERPLSPHLQIYRLTLTMAMSIAHRVTGVALYFGTLLLVWWLVTAASSARQYDIVNGFFSSWIGRVVLFGYTFALMHHLVGGIRHLIWDTGHGLGPVEREFFARATIIGSVALTFAVWLLGYMLKG